MSEATKHPGLCSRCRHLKTITSGRGSVFFLCQLARTDARFSKYPPIPVIACPGFEARAQPPR